MAVASVPGCLQNRQTNFLIVEYSCLAIEESIKAALPIYQAVSGPTLHIFSPRFPDKMPPGQYSFSCSITPADSAVRGIFSVRLQQWFVTFTHSAVYCIEELHINGRGTALKICSETEEWNHANVIHTEHLFSMTYTKQKDTYGGRFWLQMTGVKDGEDIDLKITCPDQSQIPGYSPPPPTTTTTSPPTPPPTPPTTPPTTKMTTARSSDPGTTSAARGDDNSQTDSNNSTLYGIIGALACAVIIAIAVALFFFCRYRKNKKESGNVTQQSETVSNVLATNPENDRTVQNVEAAPEYADTIQPSDTGYQNTPRMYVTPIGQKYENFPQNQNGNVTSETDEYDYVLNPVEIAQSKNYENTGEQSTYEDLNEETREARDPGNEVYTKLDEHTNKRSSRA